MTLQEILDKIKEDQDLGKKLAVAMSTTDSGKEILSNFAKAEFEKNVKETVSEIHNRYDNDIFEITGERKKDGEKTYDFVKKLVADGKKLKDSSGGNESDKIKSLEVKIKELQDGGEANKHWKEIHESAVAKFEKEKAELQGNAKEKEAEFNKMLILNDFKKGMSSVSFLDSVPEEAVKAMTDSLESRVLSTAKIVDGKVVYQKQDGTPWLNEEYKPATPEQIYMESLGSVIKKSENSSGGSAPKDGGKSSIVSVGEGDKATKKLVLDRAKFSTKLEFQKHAAEVLQKQGVSRNDDSYNSMLDGAYKEYEVKEMKLS